MADNTSASNLKHSEKYTSYFSEIISNLLSCIYLLSESIKKLLSLKEHFLIGTEKGSHRRSRETKEGTN